eukprot:1331691-Prymnesium_polylepis.1
MRCICTATGVERCISRLDTAEPPLLNAATPESVTKRQRSGERGEDEAHMQLAGRWAYEIRDCSPGHDA